MSEERLKILQMLSEGKISVEESLKLLEAVEPNAEAPRSRRGRRRRSASERSGFAFDEEIRERMEDARETLRQSIPHASRRLREVMPEVEQAIDDAVGAIPDIGAMVRETLKSVADAVPRWANEGDWGKRHHTKAERQIGDSARFPKGGRLAVNNPKGSIRVTTWDREEVEVEGKVEAKASTLDRARAGAECVRLTVSEDESGARVLVDASGEAAPEDWRADLVIRIPAEATLDLDSRHGSLETGAVQGSVTARHQHGAVKIGGTGGDLTLHHAHGEVEFGSVGGKALIDVQHGSTRGGDVGDGLTCNARHGNVTLSAVGSSVETSIHHGGLKADAVGGALKVEVRHGRVQTDALGGDLTVNARHSRIAASAVGGDVQVTSRHGRVDVARVGGDLLVEGHHTPLRVDGVGGRAGVKSHYGSVVVRNVGKDVSVESHRGNVRVCTAGGRVAIQNESARTEVEDAAGGVVVQSRKGPVTVASSEPVTAPCTIQSVEGHVDLQLPDGSSVDIKAYVRQGQVRTELPLNVERTQRGEQAVTGILGDGGEQVAIEVDKGDLNIHT